MALKSKKKYRACQNSSAELSEMIYGMVDLMGEEKALAFLFSFPQKPPEKPSWQKEILKHAAKKRIA